MTTQPLFGLQPEDLSVRGVFRNFLTEQQIDPNSIFGRISGSLQNPLFNTFSLGRTVQGLAPGLNLGGAAFGNNFTDFLGTGSGNQLAGAQGLLGALGNNFGGVQNNDLRETLQGTFGGATPGSQTGNAIEDLTRLGLRNRLGSTASGLFGNQLINSANDVFEQRLAGSNPNQQPNFAQFLVNALGLA